MRQLIGSILYYFLSAQPEFRAAEKSLSEIKKMLTPEKIANAKDKNLFLFPKKGLKVRFDKQSSDKDYAWYHISVPLQVAEFNSTKDFYFPALSHNQVDEASLTVAKPFLEALWATKVVRQVSIDAFSIRIHKAATESWKDASPVIMDAIVSCFPDIKQKAVEEEIIHAS